MSSRRDHQQEPVQDDLLQELDGREGAVVHAIFVDDVPRPLVRLEALLERRELRRRVGHGARRLRRGGSGGGKGIAEIPA